MLVAGYFKADLAHLEGAGRDEEISEALIEVNLGDMVTHFLPQ